MMNEYVVGFQVVRSGDIRVVACSMEEAIQKATEKAMRRWPEAEVIFDDVVVVGPAAR